MGKRVLILCNYPHGVAPSQRFRFEQYIDLLEHAGIRTTVESFFEPSMWRVLYKPGNTLLKAWGVIKGFGRRFWMLLTVRRYDYVFLSLEAAPLGPPVIEWLLFHLGCKVVYDIDDVIFMSRTSAANRIVSRLRWRSKVAYIAGGSCRVTACNRFLANWALQFNENSQVLPTTIDPESYTRTAERPQGVRPVIGWIGSRSNLSYLELVIPALRRLELVHDFIFRVICDVAPEPPCLEKYEFVPWSADTEVECLQTFNIGLMPVPDDLWAKGKVGLKAIQYSAFEIVPVASDVGSGPEVIIHGETGFLVENVDDEWFRALNWLLENPDSWKRLGASARKHILATYSVPSQAGAYIRLFE